MYLFYLHIEKQSIIFAMSFNLIRINTFSNISYETRQNQKKAMQQICNNDIYLPVSTQSCY